MKYGAALALAGALASVQAQRLDTGFVTEAELEALTDGNFAAWGDIEIGDTSIMSLESILAELDAITGDYPYNYYDPYAYYPPPLTIPRPIPGYPGLVNNVNLLMPSSTIHINDDTTDGVETDIRTQVTFVFPLDTFGKSCQFIFFLGNTSTVTGSGRFTLFLNANPTTSCPTTDPPTILETEQILTATYQAKVADLAVVVAPTGNTVLVGTNTACPAPGTVLTLELRGWDDSLAERRFVNRSASSALMDVGEPSTIAWNGIFSGPAIKYTTPPNTDPLVNIDLGNNISIESIPIDDTIPIVNTTIPTLINDTIPTIVNTTVPTIVNTTLPIVSTIPIVNTTTPKPLICVLVSRLFG
ncbi:hypothetical protein B0H65DRAFT_590071 [Neurospora tetraspora]|uniref:Ubiquitin 3 binding protein But2 C-terminal domain-containing protein n=1 Tax=Neurospora tetraspora TaxID=94610 RepID=A0AAE0JER0_9PEZI|nr:hypothetical protein B0H65DRAFT_590071 [Neurospora tetraspora]